MRSVRRRDSTSARGTRRAPVRRDLPLRGKRKSRLAPDPRRQRRRRSPAPCPARGPAPEAGPAPTAGAGVDPAAPAPRPGAAAGVGGEAEDNVHTLVAAHIEVTAGPTAEVIPEVGHIPADGDQGQTPTTVIPAAAGA